MRSCFGEASASEVVRPVDCGAECDENQRSSLLGHLWSLRMTLISCLRASCSDQSKADDVGFGSQRATCLVIMSER